MLRSGVMLTIAFSMLLSDLGTGSVWAQQSKRLIGGGRILRKIRSEVFGIDPQSKKSSAKTNEKSNSKTKSSKGSSKGKTAAKQPTLAVRPQASPSRVAQPTPAIRPTRTPDRNGNDRDNAFAARLPKQADISKSRPLIAGQPPQRDPSKVTRSTPAPTLGFGMLVEARGDEIVVAKIDPKGNAKEAGIKRGDVIIRGGGIDFGSVDEFNQVAEILKDGDQLEFEVERRGKEETVLILFGEAPENSEDIENEIAPGEPLSAKRAPIQPKNKTAPQLDDNQFEIGSQLNTKNNYSFLPTSKETSRRPVLAAPQTGGQPSKLNSVLGSVVQPARQPTSQSDQWKSAESLRQSSVQRQLQLQQLEIQRLRNELKRAQQKSQPDLDGPTLSGPGR